MIPPQPTILDSALLKGAEAAHHFVTVVSTGWNEFWNRDPDTVLADLNADVEKFVAVSALTEQAATAGNALLDAINDPRFSRRAPVGMPAYWSFDGTAFAYSPPLPPEVTEASPHPFTEP